MKAQDLHNPDVIGMNDGNNGKSMGLIDGETDHYLAVVCQ